MNTENNQVLIEKDDSRIVTITINKPKSLNALSVSVLEKLRDSLKSLEDEDVLGIIITGSGEKSFVAGADIKEMLSMSTEDAIRFSSLGQEVTILLESLRVPTIACVNGFAFGGGLELALGADFIYCSSNAVFGLPEVKLGLIPGFGGTQRLARLIGRNKAREIIYTGKNISADEAVSLGIVNQLFDTVPDLLSEARKTLIKIQNNSLYAIGEAKRALLDGVDIQLKDGMQIERDIFSSLFTSFDAKEGTMAFSDKRKAKFQHQRGDS